MTNSFPSKTNPAQCIKGCGVKIYLSKKGNRYLPYDALTDEIHECANREPIDKQETGQGKPEQDREARIAHVIEMIRSIIPELEALK